MNRNHWFAAFTAVAYAGMIACGVAMILLY
jgi:hypothetical protein